MSFDEDELSILMAYEAGVLDAQDALRALGGITIEELHLYEREAVSEGILIARERIEKGYAA